MLDPPFLPQISRGDIFLLSSPGEQGHRQDLSIQTALSLDPLEDKTYGTFKIHLKQHGVGAVMPNTLAGLLLRSHIWVPLVLALFQAYSFYLLLIL